MNHPVLVPEYPWEEKCVEGASVVQMGDEMFMFYAGAYNNRPQQIGVAKVVMVFIGQNFLINPF